MKNPRPANYYNAAHYSLTLEEFLAWIDSGKDVSAVHIMRDEYSRLLRYLVTDGTQLISSMEPEERAMFIEFVLLAEQDEAAYQQLCLSMIDSM